MDAQHRAVALPFDIVIVHRAPRWEVFRQLAPLAASGEHVEDGVEEARRPPLRSGGRYGSISAHSSSVTSLGYLDPLRL